MDAVKIYEDASKRLEAGLIGVNEYNKIIDPLKNVETARVWIPVTEQLPPIPDGELDAVFISDELVPADQYIVMIKDGVIPTALYWTAQGFWWDAETHTKYEVVEWTLFPEPPERIKRSSQR